MPVKGALYQADDRCLAIQSLTRPLEGLIGAQRAQNLFTFRRERDVFLV